MTSYLCEARFLAVAMNKKKKKMLEFSCGSGGKGASWTLHAEDMDKNK